MGHPESQPQLLLHWQSIPPNVQGPLNEVAQSSQWEMCMTVLGTRVYVFDSAKNQMKELTVLPICHGHTNTEPFSSTPYMQ